MRKITRVLLIVAVWLGTQGTIVHADGMIFPEALGSDYLVVRYHHVTVDIKEGHAVTRVQQEFYNPQAFPVDARYLFPVPPDAILSRFEAQVDGFTQAYVRQDAIETNATLYDMVARQGDPSLFQYLDWESLVFDLSLPAGGSRQMSLEYEEVLAPSGGLYRYRYVLSTERYSFQPLEKVSLTVKLQVASGLSSLYSPTHPVKIETLGPDGALVTWAADNVLPTEDFSLFFAPSEGGFGGGLLTGSRADQDHFLFLFAPEAGPTQGQVLPKDIVFVIDRSGSMSGEKIQQAQNALHFILSQLDEQDRFSIVGFDHRQSLLSSELLRVGEESLNQAHRFVDGLIADGNTDLEAAARIGLQVLFHSEPREAARIVVFLTDGLPTAGVIDEALIAKLVADTNAQTQARLHVFGVGYDVNTHLLDRLASENGGTVTYVQPGENLETVLIDFSIRIAQPVLTDLKITFEGMETADLYPQALPDLFGGSSLLLTGRYRATASQAVVQVRGRAGDEERTYTYRFDLQQTRGKEPAAEGYDFVPRLWATRRVGELLDQVRVSGESPELVAEIRELGLGYGLVTPYTTFFIEAQAEGAASAANMALYADQANLNQAWGQTTVMARIQNQQYQQAAQANLASGANVVNNGMHSLAQVGSQFVDLDLLQGSPASAMPWQQQSENSVGPEWIERNIGVDRIVVFGTPEYFALADDPAARPFLQSGRNVIFTYQGQVISVQDSGELVGVDETPSRTLLEQVLTWLSHVLSSWIGW